MVWLPDHVWKKQQKGKGGGKGGMMNVIQALMGGGGGGKKWGKKKGKMGMVGQVAKKTPEKVVWIGGLLSRNYPCCGPLYL